MWLKLVMSLLQICEDKFSETPLVTLVMADLKHGRVHHDRAAINASRQNTSQSGCAQRASSGGHGSATSKQSATQSGLVASLSLTSATQSGSAVVAGRVDQVSGDDGSKETHREKVELW